jgi:hypothetical protein
VADRNGNANLADNADRMESFAREHYARRAAELQRRGLSDPLLADPAPAPTFPIDAPPGSNWRWWWPFNP